MKNMIELPTQKDYHKTTVIDIREQSYNLMMAAPKQSEIIHYRQGAINMRSIMDMLENEIICTVLDEEKSKDWEKRCEEFHNSIRAEVSPEYQNRQTTGGEMPLPEAIEMPRISPPPPTREFRLKCTTILYFNGIQRLIVDDFKEFQEKYFNYLQQQQLDLRS